MSLAFKIEDSFDVSLPRLTTVLNDVDSWQIEDRPRLLLSKPDRIQFAFEDGTRAIIDWQTAGEIVQLRIVHELLNMPDSEIEPRRNWWQEVLGQIHSRLEQF